MPAGVSGTASRTAWSMLGTAAGSARRSCGPTRTRRSSPPARRAPVPVAPRSDSQAPGLAPLAGHVGEGPPGGDGAGQPGRGDDEDDQSARRPPRAGAPASGRPARAASPRSSACASPTASGSRTRGSALWMLRNATRGPSSIAWASGASGDETGPRCGTPSRTTPSAERHEEEPSLGQTPQGEPRQGQSRDEGRGDDEKRTGGDGIPGRPPLAARGDDEPQPVGRAAGDVEEVDLPHDVGGALDPVEEGRRPASQEHERRPATTRSPR